MAYPSDAQNGQLLPWNPSLLLDPRHAAFSADPPSQAPTSAPSSVFGAPGMPSDYGLNPQDFTTGSLSTESNPGPGSGSAEVAFHFMGPATDDGYLSSGDQITIHENPITADGASAMVHLHAPSMVTTAAPPADIIVVPDTNGAAFMVERNFHLQHRHDVPEPKRRKIASPAPTNALKYDSSGILAEGIRSEETKAATTTIPHSVVAHPKNPVTVDLTDARSMSVSRFRELSREVCFGLLHGVTVDCHKLPVPKPGIEAIGGPAYWPAVKIVLRRKVNDTTHTIQVYDHTREVFGSLDQRAAECLSPLMDIPKIQLRTEARIPSRRKLDGEIIGRPISRAYKIELVLYGSPSFVKPIGKRLTKYNLRLVHPHRLEPGIRLVNPHEHMQSQFNGSAGRPPLARVVPMQTPPIASVPARSMDEIRSEVMNVFDSMANAEDLPEMEPVSQVLTPLLRHQKQALYFMTNREKPWSEHVKSKLTSSIWQTKEVGGQTVFYNVITGQTEVVPPSESLGGILADMMGLGKTLSILSLVAQSKAEAEAWRKAAPVQPKAPERKKKGNMPSNFEAPQPQTLGLSRLQQNGRGTLLVCPLSTITNWEEQIKQHLEPEYLNYHIYHGQNREKDIDKLSKFDLVVTTYGSVSSELTARTKKKTGKYPLEEIGWFRVVLDEAHMIREPTTLQFKAICRLQANRRWAVTGTPVQNRLEDLGSLLSFLRLTPFDEKSKFAYYIINPFRACDPSILPKIRILVDTITLRRLKDKIDLPPRTDRTVRLDFSENEARLYNFFSQNAKDRLQALTSQNERLLGGKTYIHILQAILRLRLICAHGRDLLTDDDLKLMQGMSKESAIDLDDDDDSSGGVKGPVPEAKVYEMFDLMTNTNSDMCAHCKRKLGSQDGVSTNIRSEKQEDVLGYMTPCFHVFCPDCVSHFRDVESGLSHKSNKPGKCPVCQDSVIFTVSEIRHDRADGEHDAPRHGRHAASNDAGATSTGGMTDGASGSAPTRSNGKTINMDEYTGPHTKTLALVSELLDHQKESAAHPDEPPIKSVVFSGWTSHLDLIQIALRDNGIRYCRLDGKMSRLARSQAMDTFREDPSVPVILVSIMAGGLGLNLTTGNYVYVMEPQYNPAAEAQAVDRVHRLGQTRPVYTVRYIMRNSFEERMLDIQNMKIKLANLSMNRGADRAASVADAARQRLQDLRSLFK